MQEECDLCVKCGNHHNGQCSTETTYIFWYPQADNPQPSIVEIVGSWHHWQSHQRMQRQADQKGDIFFQIGIGLPVGYYQYKYLVDGQWKYRQDSPHIENTFGGYNNYIQVLPKTAMVEYHSEHSIKISSTITVNGLKIIGSWDNWKSQKPMQLMYNSLKGSQQKYKSIAYLQLIPNRNYEFKFKIRNQYLIDQKYPTISNQEGSLNNYLYVKDCYTTPSAIKAKSTCNSQGFTCKIFEWKHHVISSDVSFHKQLLQGHSMCQIGEYVYIFGGRLRNDYTSRLVKVNIHKLNNFVPQQIMPCERAFHHAVAYGNKMLIYGGHNKSILQDYIVYDTNTHEWQNPPEISGTPPQKSQNKSMVLYQTFLVLFGGYYCSPDFQYQTTFNDIQVIDIKLMKWIDHDLIKVSKIKPQPRYLHTASIIDSDMYVFGGKILNQSSLNDIWKINLESVTDLKWEQQKPRGKPPSPRHGHTTDIIQKYLIIYGGKNSQLLGDIIVYNSQQNQWIYPIISNPQNIPAPRAFHASTVINNEEIILFGGKNESFQTTTIYSLRPKQQGKNLLDIEQEDDDDDNIVQIQGKTRKKRLKTEQIIRTKQIIQIQEITSTDQQLKKQ